MSCDFSALNIPELTVNPEKIFSDNNAQYLAYVLLTEFEIENSPFYSGLKPENIASESLGKDESRQEIAAKLKEAGSHLLKAYETQIHGKPDGGKKRWSHADQRRVLEQAIRLFDKADGQGQDVALEMGKAYLYRSRIIRAKAFTIPAKKKESLKKALEYCEKAISEAAHYAGMVALEMDRCGLTSETSGDRLISNNELKDFLRNATIDVDVEKLEYQQKIESCEMRVWLEELEKGRYDAPALLKVFKLDRLELEKYIVALQMPGKYNKKTAGYYKKPLLKQLEKQPFSHPLWEDTVRFLSRVYRMCQSDKPDNLSETAFERLKRFWPDFALELWKTAEKISRLTSALHLRWYWSRQRDLYDIAFLAAIDREDYKCAAEIADSAKSRPAMTWQALERLSGEDGADENLKKSIEQYACALAGGYISGFEDVRPDEDLPENAPFLEKSADNTIIIQFYLVHLKGFEKGYAIICDKNGWKYQPEYSFDFNPIWQAYLKWQTVYFELPAGSRVQSASELRYLCDKMGEHLGFLFDFAFEDEEKDLLIVPHDFLHRVPVHGAIKGQDILLAKFECRYLPALSYKSEKEICKDRSYVLIQYYDEQSEKDWEDKNETGEDIIEDGGFDASKSCISAAPKDFIKAIESPDVSMIAVRCHGTADTVNPFLSGLKLKDKLSLFELYNLSDEKVSGKWIFMGACETDLIPPTDSPLDEHISISSVLLNKKAGALIGTMWEANDERVITMVEDKKIFKKFSKFQADKLKKISNDRLYNTLCFRFYGDK